MPVYISRILKYAFRFLGPSLGFMPKDVSARSLCAAGSMALLFSDVETDIVMLVGRWHSDEILRYLNVQADPLKRKNLKRMVQYEIYCINPNHEVTGLVPCY